MKYILQYTKHAKKDLQNLGQDNSRRIILKLENYCLNASNSLQSAKKLTGVFKGLYRFRVGSYRIIFHKNAKGKITILTILRVKHRKEIYKIF